MALDKTEFGHRFNTLLTEFVLLMNERPEESAFDSDMVRTVATQVPATVRQCVSAGELTEVHLDLVNQVAEAIVSLLDTPRRQQLEIVRAVVTNRKSWLFEIGVSSEQYEAVIVSIDAAVEAA